MNKLVKVAGLVAAFVIAENSSFAQQEKSTKSGDVPKGWHLLDKTKDGYYGISIDKAYEFIRTKNLKGKTVLVAVIDSGVDTLHEDQKDILWVNPKEIPGNGIDDDGNGYIDDIHGWNFIGGKDGKNVKQDSYEGARVYHMYKTKFAERNIDTTKLSADDKDEYRMWLKSKKKIEGEGNEEGVDLVMLKRALISAQKSASSMRKFLSKETYTGNDVDTFNAVSPQEKGAWASLLYVFKANQMMETTNKEVLDGFGRDAEADVGDRLAVDFFGRDAGDVAKQIHHGAAAVAGVDRRIDLQELAVFALDLA